MRINLINHKKGVKPNINLTVRRVESNSFASLGFAKEHYLTAAINPSCKCLLFEWNGIPVGFVGILNTPRKGIPYSCSVSRIVILPAYQGLGLSMKIMDFVGGIVKSLSTDTDDYRLYIKTAHTLMGEGLGRNQNWLPTCFDGKMRKDTTEKSGKYKNHLLRKSYCKEFIGNKINGYQDLLLPIKIMRENKAK